MLFFTKYLQEKDSNTNLELEIDFSDNSSHSNNPFIIYFKSQSGMYDEINSFDVDEKAVIKRRRKIRSGTHNIVNYNCR